jgi:hypothetical protein
MISAMIRETCHFTIDRTNLYTKWWVSRIKLHKYRTKDMSESALQ